MRGAACVNYKFRNEGLLSVNNECILTHTTHYNLLKTYLSFKSLNQNGYFTNKME